MESVRLRVVFEDGDLLNKTQKSQGLKRSWILLKPDLETISDLSSYLIHSFNLQHACPNNALRLSMDGFVLPYFESTRVFKDKDIIRVKRKEGAATDIIRIGDEANSLEDFEVVEKPLLTGVNLLAFEEFEKEIGGYQSEPEEIDYNSPENTLHLETPLSGKSTSKKRKSSKKLQSAKRKRIKSTSPENSSKVPVEGVENDVRSKDQDRCHKVLSRKSVHKDRSSKTSVKGNKASTTDVGNITENNGECMPNEERFDKIQEDGKKALEESENPEGTKKGPSRSARRKKAKRKWLRELVNSQKKELIQSHIPDKVVQNKSPKRQDSEKDTDTEAEIVPIVIKPGHIRFEPLGKDQVIRQTQDNAENFQWNGITRKRKGQKWGMEKTSVSKSNDYEESREDTIENQSENFQWNGITSKRKGQKWGMEKTSAFESNVDDDFREDSMEKLTIEEREVVHDPVDFEKLKPLCGLPKEGDVVAYRLVELSSTWCPELSSFRVGKVSWFDTASNRVMLAPVPGYPVLSDEKRDEEEDITQQSVSSLYGEDGSLEIDFVSLVDVRIFSHDHSNRETVVTGGSKEASVRRKSPVSCEDAVSCVRPNDNNEETRATGTDNGGSVDVWEQISQVLSEKKTQLSEQKKEGWTQKESSGKSQWSYKALRSSALGPTMALLRAGNGL